MAPSCRQLSAAFEVHHIRLSAYFKQSDSQAPGHAEPQVLELLAAGHTNYSPHPDMPAAVEALIRSSTTADPAPATFRLGQGVWEVGRNFDIFSPMSVWEWHARTRPQRHCSRPCAGVLPSDKLGYEGGLLIQNALSHYKTLEKIGDGMHLALLAWLT